jgi:hypothetical protein
MKGGKLIWWKKYYLFLTRFTVRNGSKKLSRFEKHAVWPE